MLIFAGVTTESSTSGNRHMLVFHSPRLPGIHYKVETDEGTVKRLKTIIGSEVESMMAADFFNDEENYDTGPRFDG